MGCGTKTAWGWHAVLLLALVVPAGCGVPYRVSFPLGGRALDDVWTRPGGNLAGGLESGIGLGGVNLTFQPGRLRIGPEILVQYSTAGDGEETAFTSEGFVELYEYQVGAVMSFIALDGKLHSFAGLGLADASVKEDYTLGQDWAAEFFRHTGEATGYYLHAGVLWCPAGGFHLGFDVRYVGGTQMQTTGRRSYWDTGSVPYQYLTESIASESRDADGVQYSVLVGWHQNW